jgi:hypothetical protein
VTREPLTREEREQARRIFEGHEFDRHNQPRHGCYHCAGIHDVVDGLPPYRQPCHRVKSAKWTTNGELLEVEYWPRGKWEPDDVIFPSEAYVEDESEGES